MKDMTKDELLRIFTETKRDFSLFTEEEKERARNNGNIAEMKADLFAFAEREKNTLTAAPKFSDFIRFDTDGDRDAFEYDGVTGYFAPRHRMIAFFLMAWLYEKEEYLAPLFDTMWALCNEYSWALPAHMFGKSLTRLETDGYTVDLFGAQTADDLAEILYLLGDKVPPILAMRVRREIRVRTFDALYGEGVRDFWWKRTKCNWAAVCAGSVGIAAMLLEDDPEKLTDLVYPLFDTMKCFLRGYTDEGVCTEGMAYWMYGFGYFMFFSDVLYKRTEGRIDLFDDEKVKNISAFPAATLFGHGLCLPFSDAEGVIHLRRGMMDFVARRYPDLPKVEDEAIQKHIRFDGAERFPDAVRNFIWSGETFPETVVKKGKVYPFAGAAWYIATAETGLTFMAKAGNNDESHNHDDVGHFALCKDGVPLFWDSGCGNYSKQYFGKERYEYVECSSRGHSVPIVGGHLQNHGKKKVGERDVPYAAENTVLTAAGIRAEIAPVYDLDFMPSLVRDMSFDVKSGRIRIADTFVFTVPGTEVRERFVSLTKPEKTENGVLLSADGVCVRLADSLGGEVVFSSERCMDVYGEEPKGREIFFTDFIYRAEENFAVTFTIEEVTNG